MFKKLAILVIAAVITVSNVVSQSNNEMTVEESYMQETIELQIIRETARASSREQKEVALHYISEAIEKGNKSDSIRQTLDYLSREGRRSVAMESGRVVNNFPDIRRQSAKYLGQLGTEEARLTLLQVIQYENEPMVLQEAIKSLGDIGVVDNNNDTFIFISWIFDRFDTLNPDNLMAIATIDTFEKIAKNNNGTISKEAISTLRRISEGHYITPVKERAAQLLSDLRGYSN